MKAEKLIKKVTQQLNVFFLPSTCRCDCAWRLITRTKEDIHVITFLIK